MNFAATEKLKMERLMLQQNKGGDTMKRLIAFTLALVLVLSLVGCSTKDKVIGESVFETKNIASVTFYGSAPNSTETEVPSEYLTEITECSKFNSSAQCIGILIFLISPGSNVRTPPP